MARAKASTLDVRGQLTITETLEDFAKRVEVHDPMRPAKRLLLVVLALMGLGFLIQVSHAATTLSQEDFLREVRSQALFRLAGVAVILLAFRIGPSRVAKVLPHLMVLCALALLAVFVPPFAEPRNGSNRWLDLSAIGLPLVFQPSEVARIVLVLWIADRCTKLGSLVRNLRRGVLPILAVTSVLFLLVCCETDLGGGLVLFLCALATLWVGGAQVLSVGGILATIGGGAIMLGNAFVPYIRNRFGMWRGEIHNEQVARTLDALTSGGTIGAGYTHGVFRNNGVPYLNSDYVFALVGEELGVLGMCLVLALLLAFLWFAARLVLSIRERFEALACFGLLTSVAMQAVVHVQVVTGLAPPKGMTLPFLSDGGTSLIVSALAVGLALGAAKKTHEDLYPCTR
ncbi:MAG TPA: hypothetical protein ENJ09_06635 [Planctomycetes bacterium]|nr:hypothetical protein [Planctomycetota bacterium]